ncbi:hypothetical protein N7492_006801 [Penicillium capsulatum]|uniref:Uncharacterized protein n=1 Tax=Penicillium capsulatum TaxID=69766 RepID=A0A9W9I005_9EURO|nr:hypothetical protein N7492_006801 [Penicillium capsulatum]KAJ6116636.1 hypothetical protein N7512_006361 [Penicillium capsulatum]
MEPQSPSAAQKVLALPELLSLIMFWLTQGHDNNGHQSYAVNAYHVATLFSCALVNRVWFHEAVRYLWNWRSNTLAISLPQTLTGVSPWRRRMYADIITSATLVEANKFTIQANNSALACLSFPKLTTLTLVLNAGLQRLNIPSIDAPVLKTVRLRIGSTSKMVVEAKFKLHFGIEFPWRRHYQTRAGVLSLLCPKHTLRRGIARMFVRQVPETVGYPRVLVFGPEVSLTEATLEVLIQGLPGVVLVTEHPGFVVNAAAEAVRLMQLNSVPIAPYSPR